MLNTTRGSSNGGPSNGPVVLQMVPGIIRIPLVGGEFLERTPAEQDAFIEAERKDAEQQERRRRQSGW